MKLSIADINAREYFPYLNGERILTCWEADEETGTLVINHGDSYFLDRERQFEEKQGIVQLIHRDLIPAMEKVKTELIKGFTRIRYAQRDIEQSYLIEALCTALAIEKVNHKLDNVNSDETLDSKTALILTVNWFES